MAQIKNAQQKKVPKTEHPWLKMFLEQPDLMHIKQNLTDLLPEFSLHPSLELQKMDVKTNLESMLERPLLRIQTERLLHDLNSTNTLQIFEEFSLLWEPELLISSDSLKYFDPKTTQLRFANADTRRYKQLLVHILYLIWVGLPEIHSNQNDLDAYIAWLNGIEKAQTTAKVTLRRAPDIQSEILFELPKHSVVSVYSSNNPHWKKVRIEDQDAYVMSAYLKFNA